MAISPVTEEIDLVSYTILSNGKEIPSTYEIVSIQIVQQLNRISEAEIILIDGSVTKQKFDVAESNTFVPGAEIEIKLGYHGKDDSVYKGLVIKQNLIINHDSSTRLRIICKDHALKMTVCKNSAIYTNATDGSILKTLIQNSGLSADVATTTEEHKEVVQYCTTDWDFLVTRAEVNGLVVLTDNGKVVISKPAVSGSPVLEVEYGRDVYAFDGELDATFQYSEAKRNSWDMSTQKVIEATSSEPTVNKQGNISGKKLSEVLDAGATLLSSSAAITNDTLSTWANATVLKSRLSRFKGTLTFQGSSKATANSTISLKGLSDRFNGDAFISGVTHLIENGTWLTEVRLGLENKWFAETNQAAAPMASGLIPGVKGLQTGVVKKIDEDPDNQFRVQVEIPLLNAENEAVWARLSTFYASNTFGAYFMPEIGDEVILGFMNDDPRFPIILGSVYSSKLPAPETPNKENTIKTLVTKSKLQLKFDDEKKIITVLTPSGNTMVFSDEDEAITVSDQNSNKITMNRDGISLESPSNIAIKATQDVSIKGATISINGDRSIDASGGNVAISAEMSASLKGSADCAISSDGNLTAKGLMVLIN
ncbi:type VI secretion system tip protein VgrG [Rasiella rasia]|uniref:Type VI secretion system tip protein VgrG n=1 Tax=Rasiella rasia TaxID=2744027 RepID=A0A6G6GPZ0_9FLAO|nr:type VI secretion system tip protein VgrG [Rasiella rasia]QIE59781.1 type VI secretion system tip protein VgrG [Rasiella rasia]